MYQSSEDTVTFKLYSMDEPRMSRATINIVCDRIVSDYPFLDYHIHHRRNVFKGVPAIIEVTFTVDERKYLKFKSCGGIVPLMLHYDLTNEGRGLVWTQGSVQ